MFSRKHTFWNIFVHLIFVAHFKNISLASVRFGSKSVFVCFRMCILLKMLSQCTKMYKNVTPVYISYTHNNKITTKTTTKTATSTTKMCIHEHKCTKMCIYVHKKTFPAPFGTPWSWCTKMYIGVTFWVHFCTLG